jgi:hypothetical protein
MTKNGKGRSGDAAFPEFFANAAGGCDTGAIEQIAEFFNGTATPRRANNFPRDRLGHYVEPHWCSVRLFAVESFGAPGAVVFDPACGWGRILQAATAAGYTPIGSDLVDRRGDAYAFSDFRFSVCNFLNNAPIHAPWSVVTNPPFNEDLIRQFCEHGLDVAVDKVAVLMPLRRLPAAHWLRRLPLETIWLLTPRPSMPPASWIAAGNEPGGGTQDFCWLVFNKKQAATSRAPRLRWLHRDPVRP